MRIEHSLSALKTPAFAIIAEGWNELVQSGHTAEGVALCPVLGHDEVIYAVASDGDVVGVIAYRPAWSDRSEHGMISLAYVEPSSRKKGVFKAMYAMLKTSALRHKWLKITLDTPPENMELQSFLRHMDVSIATLSYEMRA